MNNKVLLSSNIRRILGFQKVPCILELGTDKVLRLYHQTNNTLLYEAPAGSITYSAASVVKSRLRLVSPSWGVRIGIWSVSADKSTISPAANQSARDLWVTTLKEHGATEDPKQPEAKLDKIGLWSAAFWVIMLLLVTVLVITMR